MKQFIDFLPLILFFVIAKMEPRTIMLLGHDLQIGGIISATACLILSTLAVYSLLWYRNKRLDAGQVITLVSVLVLGGMTVLVRDETFLKWKAPLVNGVLSAAFLFSRWRGGPWLIERLLSRNLTLPASVWCKLNLSWGLFFAVLGIANWYVAFVLPGDFWISFKVFGNLGLTLVFVIVQMVLLSRYIKQQARDLTETP